MAVEQAGQLVVIGQVAQALLVPVPLSVSSGSKRGGDDGSSVSSESPRWRVWPPDAWHEHEGPPVANDAFYWALGVRQVLEVFEPEPTTPVERGRV
jgi:hypothetical protein